MVFYPSKSDINISKFERQDWSATVYGDKFEEELSDNMTSERVMFLLWELMLVATMQVIRLLGDQEQGSSFFSIVLPFTGDQRNKIVWKQVHSVRNL